MSFMKPGIDKRHVIEQARNAKGLATLAGENGVQVDTAKVLEGIKSDKAKPAVVICTKEDLIAFREKCKGKSQDEILTYLGIESTYNEDGSKTLSHYKWPFHGYSFSAAGIDEAQLLDSVTHIKGNVDLTGSSLKDLGSVRKIGGSLKIPLFTSAKDLSSVQSIGRNVICEVENSQDAINLIKKVKLNPKYLGGYIDTGDFGQAYRDCGIKFSQNMYEALNKLQTQQLYE